MYWRNIGEGQPAGTCRRSSTEVASTPGGSGRNCGGGERPAGGYRVKERETADSRRKVKRPKVGRRARAYCRMQALVQPSRAAATLMPPFPSNARLPQAPPRRPSRANTSPRLRLVWASVSRHTPAAPAPRSERCIENDVSARACVRACVRVWRALRMMSVCVCVRARVIACVGARVARLENDVAALAAVDLDERRAHLNLPRRRVGGRPAAAQAMACWRYGTRRGVQHATRPAAASAIYNRRIPTRFWTDSNQLKSCAGLAGADSNKLRHRDCSNCRYSQPSRRLQRTFQRLRVPP